MRWWLKFGTAMVVLDVLAWCLGYYVIGGGGR